MKNYLSYRKFIYTNIFTDVLELDVSLEHANAANAETQKVIKK